MRDATRRTHAVAALIAVAALCITRPSHAVDPTGEESSAADPPVPVVAPPGAPPGDDLVSNTSKRTWNEGTPRVFAATTLDVGWVYLRPRLSLGWGKPFDAWVGIDANPVAWSNGVGAYGGVRLALPRFDLRAGARYIFAFNRNYLNPQPSYDRLDLSSTAGDPARIITYETELEFSIPAGPGDIIGLGSVSYVSNIPANQLVFEETLHIIVDPPWVWRGRGGYTFRFGSFEQHSIGLVADVLHVPKRDDSKTVRVGPVIRIRLSRHVEVRGSFVPTILSPDKLGIVGGDFTELGFRYRWATE